MRIHTNTLLVSDIYVAIESIPGGLVDGDVTSHGSRSHRRAYEVKLSGFGDRHTRSKNTGYAGGYADEDKAATWDDWGFLIAYLYSIDPAAVWGSVKHPTYESARHFHTVTQDRFNVAPCDFPSKPLPKLKRAELSELRRAGYEAAKLLS